jgi:hypothetical protein
MTRIILSFRRGLVYSAAMLRLILFLLAALFAFSPGLAPADVDGPLISITSPDQATTFVYGTIKDHSLVWNKDKKMLSAHVTFIDVSDDSSGTSEDTREFRLPGVDLDPAKGIFFATAPSGQTVPVAHFKKTLFMQTIEVLPNAIVRILHPHGNVTVILEAISPDDPAMHPAPARPANPDDTHQEDIQQILH